MKEVIVKITNGRFYIPAAIRKPLGLKPGRARFRLVGRKLFLEQTEAMLKRSKKKSS